MWECEGEPGEETLDGWLVMVSVVCVAEGRDDNRTVSDSGVCEIHSNLLTSYLRKKEKRKILYIVVLTGLGHQIPRPTAFSRLRPRPRLTKLPGFLTKCSLKSLTRDLLGPTMGYKSGTLSPSLLK